MSATFSYTWDYLGRLQQITYPDEEVVSYGYDSGGQVQNGHRDCTGARTTEYVKDIGYDEYRAEDLHRVWKRDPDELRLRPCAPVADEHQHAEPVGNGAAEHELSL